MTFDFDGVEQRLEALLRAEGPSRFERLWGLDQEPLDVKGEALAALFKQLRSGAGSSLATPRCLEAAFAELTSNVRVLEESSGTRAHPPFAYVTWLWRVCETLRRVQTDLERSRQAPVDADAKRERLAVSAALPVPLPPLPIGARLQGFAVQPLIDLANRETHVLSRRRRLLEAARRALLESAASLGISADKVEARMRVISAGIQEVTEWQQAGIEPDEDIAHQLRRAVHARDAAHTDAVLSVIARLDAAEPRSQTVSERLRGARSNLRRISLPGGRPTLEQMSERIFGKLAGDRVLRSCERALSEHGAPKNIKLEFLGAAAAVDASFELGRSVAPVRAIEEQRRMALVRFPTQTMVLSSARSVADLPNSLISDPRLVVHQLATESLLTRRYLAQRSRRVSVPPRYSEARYYLLDGSASMSGRRGRMRDAILLAELSSMIRHLESGTATARPVVYYRYFTSEAEPAIKVATIEEALTSIESVLLRKSRGETDIEAALIQSFQQIALERGRDSNLQRAQLVLVTDGIAHIDLSRVWQARQALGSMPVQVSVIALGTENTVLRELAATQRARGEAVFYHYVSDRGIGELVTRLHVAEPSSDVATKQPTAAPKKVEGAVVRPRAADPTEPRERETWRELDELVGELSVLRTPPDLESIEHAGFLEEAYAELGVRLSDSGLEAERARCEALRRDAHALARRFDRWFPDPHSLVARGEPPPAELLEVIEVVLLSVSELADYLSATALARSVDAIEILERLLIEAGVSPWAYVRALPHVSAASRRALTALRKAC